MTKKREEPTIVPDEDEEASAKPADTPSEPPKAEPIPVQETQPVPDGVNALTNEPDTEMPESAPIWEGQSDVAPAPVPPEEEQGGEA